MPLSDPIIHQPLFIAGALAFASLALVSVFVGRQLSLTIFFVALPFVSLPLISGRIGTIPGLSIPNIELLLASVLAIWASQLRVPINPGMKKFFFLYLAVSFLAIVIRVVNFEPITIMKLYSTTTAFDFLRSFTVQTLLVAVTFLFIAKYCAGTNNGPMLITRAWALAIIVFGTTILAMTAYYFGLSRNFNLVREAVQATIGIHSNEYVMFYAISAPLFLWAITTQQFSKRDKLICLVALGVSLVATLFSYSRSGYVVMALVVAIYAFVHNRRLLWFVLPVAIAIAVLMPATVIERAQTGLVNDTLTGTAGFDTLTSGRSRMWLYTLDHLNQGPVALLIGGGRYSFIPIGYREFGVAMPHNGYLEVILDSGLIGFAVVMGFFVYLISYFRKAMAHCAAANRPLYFAALVGIGMFMLICFSGPTFYPNIAHIPLWLLVGIAAGVRQREARQALERQPVGPFAGRKTPGYAGAVSTSARPGAARVTKRGRNLTR